MGTGVTWTVSALLTGIAPVHSCHLLLWLDVGTFQEKLKMSISGKDSSALLFATN